LNTPFAFSFLFPECEHLCILSFSISIWLHFNLFFTATSYLIRLLTTSLIYTSLSLYIVIQFFSLLESLLMSFYPNEFCNVLVWRESIGRQAGPDSSFHQHPSPRNQTLSTPYSSPIQPAYPVTNHPVSRSNPSPSSGLQSDAEEEFDSEWVCCMLSSSWFALIHSKLQSLDIASVSSEELEEEIHRVLDLEQMRYNEQLQAEEQYREDLHRLKASEELLASSSRKLQIAQHQAYCVESAVQKHGRSLTYNTVCCQRRTHEYRARELPTIPVKEISARGG